MYCKSSVFVGSSTFPDFPPLYYPTLKFSERCCRWFKNAPFWSSLILAYFGGTLSVSMRGGLIVKDLSKNIV